MDTLKEVIFYLSMAAFVAVCLFRPNLIIGFRSKKEDAKSKGDAKDKEVV